MGTHPRWSGDTSYHFTKMRGSSSVSGLRAAGTGYSALKSRPAPLLTRVKTRGMADTIIELQNGYTLVTVDLSDIPMPPDHPPDLFPAVSISSSAPIEMGAASSADAVPPPI